MSKLSYNNMQLKQSHLKWGDTFSKNNCYDLFFAPAENKFRTEKNLSHTLLLLMCTLFLSPYLKYTGVSLYGLCITWSTSLYGPVQVCITRPLPTRCQFHQYSKSSSWATKTKKIKDRQFGCLFYPFRICERKSSS